MDEETTKQLVNESAFTADFISSFGGKSHPEGLLVSVQLAVVSGLDVAPVVLVEVGEPVVHEDVALWSQEMKRWRLPFSGLQQGYLNVANGGSYFIRLVQVEGDGTGARLGAVPAEVLGAVEARTGTVNSSVIDL